MAKKLALTAFGLGLLIVGATYGMSFFAKTPDNLGVRDGRLTACPASPNCVSTRASDESHRIEPLAFAGSAEDAVERLKGILQAMPRSKIITAERNYIHAEFTSAVFRFVDDVEFLVDQPSRTIHFRSASRAGYSDLGANRKRMEAIRRRFDTD